MSKEEGTLKQYIERNLTVTGEDRKDVAELSREWLAQKDFLTIVLDAINGKTINGEKLRLRDRVNFALKLSNKILPDIKSIEQKQIVKKDIHIHHSATQELLTAAGCYDVQNAIEGEYDTEE